jgi:hypothetical protein
MMSLTPYVTILPALMPVHMDVDYVRVYQDSDKKVRYHSPCSR